MKLYLPETFQELGLFTCKEPIYFDVYHVDRKNKTVYFTWDFGMDSLIGLNSFTCKHLKRLKEKIYREVIFDLGHAFFHYEGDPNYTYYHWALKAWLENRLETNEYILRKN
jgi:hypothetical protein